MRWKWNTNKKTMAKNSPTIRMLLVSVLAMIAVSEVTADHKHAHKVVSKLIYGLANAAPNEIAGISLTNPRYWRTAIFLHPPTKDHLLQADQKV